MTVVARKFARLAAGEGGGLVERGVISFAALETTGELPINMTFVELLVLTPIAVTAGTGPDTDQDAFVNETEQNGGFKVPASGTVTINQTGASVVAMKYFYLAIGH